MGFYRYILCSLLYLLPQFIYSQQLRFKQITSEDGLSTNFVKAIIQDDLGFMWFGTQDGLNKYDGYQIRTYKNDPGNPASISCADITALKQVAHNLIIVGTREGIEFFDPTTEKFTRLRRVDGRLSTQVNVIYQTDKENVLIGTVEGLFIFNIRTRIIKNPYFRDEFNVNIQSIEKFNDVVYIGTHEKGLWKLDKKNALERVRFSVPEFSRMGPTGLATITHIGHYAGMLYLGTHSNGIYKVDRNFEISAHISFAALNEQTNNIRDFVIRNNKLYAATAHGLVVHNLLSSEVVHYTRQEAPLSLNSNLCNRIFTDNENNFWIGTDVGGVNISFFRSQKFPVSATNYERRFLNIYSFFEENHNTVMIGGESLLKQVNLTTGQSQDYDHIIGNSSALCMLGQGNSLWIGTSDNGLLLFDKYTGRARPVFGFGKDVTVRCLLADEDFIYAGTQGDGLYRIDVRTMEVRHFAEKDNLPSLNIISIFRDRKNRILLGTSDAGLVVIRKPEDEKPLQIIAAYSNKGKVGQIASNMILAINEDYAGNIWAGTSTGLSKIRVDDTIYNFYGKDGLANTYIYSLLKDSINNFWMSTNGGIIKFNPAVAEKEIVFKNYNIKDGLVNTEYNFGSALRAASGLMYFGGPKGFNVFRPSAIKDNFHAPQVYITGFQRSGTDVKTDSVITYKKHLDLLWKENYFQFELVAIDYTDPPKNKFRYMLEGYDRDWSAPTTVRFVSYTELPGGMYTFKVKAANNDGIWNEKPRTITITIVPPFWKTKTFYFLVILLLLSAIYFYTQYRTRAIIRENKLLEQKVAERTRELEEKNRDITSSIEYAKRIQEAILPSKENIFRKLKKIFILYQPKDIVSGDFYWFAEENGIKIFAVVDCTGHGVPGAFMSMIGHNLLHQIVSEREITDPGEILNQLHQGVQEALRQGHNEINTNDGMDVSLIAINTEAGEIRWAGANRPLIVIDKEKNLVKYDGDKFPVGGAQLDLSRQFTTRIITITRGSMAYMFTDGYADQFGGDRGKKFMVKRFHDLLAEIHLLDAEAQKQALKDNFEGWKQNHEQVDDVLIVGIEV